MGIDSGEAANLEEAVKLHAKRAREAYEAKYSEEERKEFGRQGMLAAAQKLIDSGEAANLEEAMSLQGSIGNRAAAQKLVDSGEAATLEEAMKLQAKRAREAYEA